MVENIILSIGSVVFAILFLFLLFIFSISIISFFKRKKYKEYTPEVSIVIPCYNEEEHIKKCLESISLLDYPMEKIEVVVVDDGSTDRTSEIAESFRRTKKLDIMVLKCSHLGKSESLNLGIKKASKKIVMTLDADTFMTRDALKKMTAPFSDSNICATSGSCIVNDKNWLSMFEKIEYYYNNLIRKSFSDVFSNGVWFFGAFMCFRRDALKKVGYFKKDTMLEDMDISMEMYSSGCKLINVHDALAYTDAPLSLRSLFNQRIRWNAGAIQTLMKHRFLFSRKSSPSTLFIFINQFWWSLFSVLFFPLVAYQVYYWMPNTGALDIFMYLFRWFTLAGPVYVLYKIPEWGISVYSIFGVMSGILSAIMIIGSIFIFKGKIGVRQIIGIFFYFPYTIILNMICVVSLIKLIFLKKRHFIY